MMCFHRLLTDAFHCLWARIYQIYQQQGNTGRDGVALLMGTSAGICRDVTPTGACSVPQASLTPSSRASQVIVMGLWHCPRSRYG
ncbi:MAG: hypothetical protein V7K53_18065 [Nostoc sp.]|uniref:hypothetical protein n=1 Tax=Nostoc sp. TaxID=1180 RepID=UPI002FF60BAE